MFAMLAIYTTALFSILAAASPVPEAAPGVCSTGSLMCCNEITSYRNVEDHDFYRTLLDLDLSDLSDKDKYIGKGCSPLASVVSASSNACSAKTVCCDNNSYGGFVNVGCMPVTM